MADAGAEVKIGARLFRMVVKLVRSGLSGFEKEDIPGIDYREASGVRRVAEPVSIRNISSAKRWKW